MIGGLFCILAVLLVVNLFTGIVNMAKLTDVQQAQAATTQAIVDLTARLGAQSPPAATEADLDGIVAAEVANKAAIDALPLTPAPVV